MKKILSLILVAAMIFSLTACGGAQQPADTSAATTVASQPTSSADTSDQSTSALQESAKEAVYRLLYDEENTTMNYLASGEWITSNMVDGLVEFDNHTNIVPALAESWENSEDGLTWTFHIRKGQYWYDCEGNQIAEVTAQNWVDGLKVVCDPYSSSSMYDQIKIVEGVEEYYNTIVNGGNADFSTVGVKALDDYTLEYKLNRVTPYFLPGLVYLCWLPAYGPLIEETMTTDPNTGNPAYGFGTAADKLYYCGGFILTEWEPQVKQTLVKNQNNWDADRVYIDRIELTYNAEAATLAPAMVLRDEIDYAKISNDIVDDWRVNNAAYLSKGRENAMWHNWLSFDFKPTYDDEYKPEDWMKAVLNSNFRHSFMSAIDREYLINTAIDTGSASSLLQNTITPSSSCYDDNGTDFADNAAFKGIEANYFNIDKAMEYKAKAIEELTAEGVTFPIQVILAYQSGDKNYENECIVLKQQLEEVLGTDYIECVLWAGPSEDFLSQTRAAGKYSFMRVKWGADYIDPQTWTDPFAGGVDTETGLMKGNTYNRWDLLTDDEAFLYAFQTIDTNSIGQYAEEFIAMDDYKEVQNILNEYYDLVDKGINEGVDMNKRFSFFAQAEALLINNALLVPCYIGKANYTATKLNVFEGAYAACGYANYQYKGMHIQDHFITMDEYEANLDAWSNGEY